LRLLSTITTPDGSFSSILLSMSDALWAISFSLRASSSDSFSAFFVSASFLFVCLSVSIYSCLFLRLKVWHISGIANPFATVIANSRQDMYPHAPQFSSSAGLFFPTILSTSLMASSGGSGILWSSGVNVLEKSRTIHLSIFFCHRSLSRVEILFSVYLLTRARLLNLSVWSSIPGPRRQP